MKKTADAILLLGLALDEDSRPVPELLERIDTAARAYKEGLSDCIVVSGGRLPGRECSEAEVMAQRLMALGIPERAIVREDRSCDTPQNMRFCRAILGGAKRPRVLIVTSDYHMLRARILALRAGFKAAGYPTRLKHDAAWKRLRAMEWAYTVDAFMGWQSDTRPAWTYKLFDAVFGKK